VDPALSTDPRSGVSRRVVFLALLTLGLVPVWAYTYFPTQDGPSHALNARVFRECADPRSPEAEFYERRISAIPNWTASAFLQVFTAVLPPLTAEKVLVSTYVVGLPLAVDYFLAALDASGSSALALLFIWNSCLLRGFYSYAVGIAVLFLILGWFLRRTTGLGTRDTAWLSILLLVAYFTHLAAFLIAVFCLLWFAASASTLRVHRMACILVAAVPGSLLTVNYLLSSGFFGTPELSSALDIAKEEVEGTLARAWDGPVVLYRELFATHSEIWLAGFVVLVACFWLWDNKLEGNPDSKRLRESVLTLSGVLLVIFILIPDTLRAHGGFLKARLAPVALLLSLGAIRSSRRGALGLRHVAGVALISINLVLVVRYVARMDREIEDFTTGISWVHAGETLISVKPLAETNAPVDPFFSEYYCIDTDAICLSSYEGGTQHFPVKMRRGVKQRIRLNKPGSFWADVVLGWGAPEDTLPQTDEPYREVYRRGKLRLFRRISGGDQAPHTTR
jgi:hypothetical protein